MNFELKYKDMRKYMTRRESIFNAETYNQCTICGKQTPFVEFKYRVYVCSDECLKKLDDEFAAACNITEDFTAEHEFEPGQIFTDMMELNP